MRAPVGSFAVEVILLIGLVSGQVARPGEAGSLAPAPGVHLRVDDGHPWRPPFGLDRIGRPLLAVAEIGAPQQPLSDYRLVALRDGQEISRCVLELAGQPPFIARASFNPWPTQLVLVAKNAQGAEVELARQDVQRVAFEAEVVARPDRSIHPVDLGTILVPSDWLLLGGAQRGTVVGAALCRSTNVVQARVSTWFESLPATTITAELSLAPDRRVDFQLAIPPLPTAGDRDRLHVSIVGTAGAPLWEKTIPVMLVRQPPRWPVFGGEYTQLRYDAPISVRADDGTYSEICYDRAWDPRLRDVVVTLPNGARFVFWRGSSYVPFWAGRCNTGLSYEWAETSPPADGYTDCVEPLMDKELRYGRVRIVESTAARVHVRWSYQSCDFQYKVWGDSAVEDFFFYPDGFGTRVLTLQSAPTADYELSEFIILTPQATYPLSVLPPNLVDILFLDGQKRELTFPYFPAEQGEKLKSRDVPAVYRVRLHRDEPLAAVYFHPREVRLPPTVFAPFSDGGQWVTPTYWGSHWPLARGKTTGSAIDDRVRFTPCHNSVMSWARQRPPPLRTAQLQTLDTLGRSQPMILQTWVWLIGMSGDDDARILEWARSFAQPPSVTLTGARLKAESYISERRAIRMIVESNPVTITIQPAPVCVNPVFELCAAPAVLAEVQLAGRQLAPHEYAWDGQTLWIGTTLKQETPLCLLFSGAFPPIP